jgi:hypothetical protein
MKRILLAFLILMVIAGCAKSNFSPQFKVENKDYNAKSVIQEFENSPQIKKAQKIYTPKEKEIEKISQELRDELLKKCPEKKRSSFKRVLFATMPPHAKPIIPVEATLAQYEGKEAFIFVQLWALPEDKDFKRGRIWVFDTEEGNFLFGRSFLLENN